MESGVDLVEVHVGILVQLEAESNFVEEAAVHCKYLEAHFVGANTAADYKFVAEELFDYCMKASEAGQAVIELVEVEYEIEIVATEHAEAEYVVAEYDEAE